MAIMNLGAQILRLALAGGLASGAFGIAFAQEQPSAAQIIEALKPKGGAPGATRSLSGLPQSPQSSKDRDFLDSLRNRRARSISIMEAREADNITKGKPSIDLEVTFEYDSDMIGPKAVPALVNLGTALRSVELKDALVLLEGHTDAVGSYPYNQKLSDRRADAVKRFLVEKFSLAPENLIPIGYGKTQLKNAADPFAGENRRVRIVNTEQR